MRRPIHPAALLLAALAACEGSTSPRVPAEVRLDPQTVALVEGASAQLVATLLDQNGDPLAIPSGMPVLWTSSVEPVATVDPSGRVTAEAPGTATIRAIVGTLIGEAAVTVRPAPTAIRINTPQDWDVYAGSPLTVQAVVLDRRGNPMGGVPLRFQVVLGGGSVTPVEMVSPGTYEPVWTLGARYGAQLLRVTSEAVPGAVAELRANAIVGPAQYAVDVTGVDTVVAGIPLEAKVQVISRYDLLMPDWPVQWDSAGTGAGPTSRTDSSGVARYSFTPTAPGDFSVTARAGKGVAVLLRFTVVAPAAR